MKLKGKPEEQTYEVKPYSLPSDPISQYNSDTNNSHSIKSCENCSVCPSLPVNSILWEKMRFFGFLNKKDVEIYERTKGTASKLLTLYVPIDCLKVYSS